MFPILVKAFIQAGCQKMVVSLRGTDTLRHKEVGKGVKEDGGEGEK